MSNWFNLTRSDNGEQVKQWAILKSGEKVFIDSQNGDGVKAWFFAGLRKIAPDSIREWLPRNPGGM